VSGSGAEASEDAIRAFVCEGAPEGVVSVYLFGSAGRDRRHRDSDIAALDDLDLVDAFVKRVAEIVEETESSDG